MFGVCFGLDMGMVSITLECNLRKIYFGIIAFFRNRNIDMKFCQASKSKEKKKKKGKRSF